MYEVSTRTTSGAQSRHDLHQSGLSIVLGDRRSNELNAAVHAGWCAYPSHQRGHPCIAPSLPCVCVSRMHSSYCIQDSSTAATLQELQQHKHHHHHSLNQHTSSAFPTTHHTSSTNPIHQSDNQWLGPQLKVRPTTCSIHCK